MALRSHLWADLTRSEIAAARDAGALVVIPIGATEQHSDHLPVGTDSLCAGRLSLLAANDSPHPVLVAPTVTAAFSPHHADWSGTISLRLSTLAALLNDITAGIAQAGFTRQLLVNGHGGNRGPLMSICAEFITSGREVGFVDYFAPAAAEIKSILTGSRGGVTHAGEAETALVMALDRDDAGRLDFYRERARGLKPRTNSPLRQGADTNPIAAAGAWWPSLYLSEDIGYNGDPGRASEETGELLVAAITARLAAFFTAYARADLKSGAPCRVVPEAGSG